MIKESSIVFYFPVLVFYYFYTIENVPLYGSYENLFNVQFIDF